MRKPLKNPISFSQQLSLLESRGLIIPNRLYAKEYLSRVNYYRLMGYCFHLKKLNSDEFISDVCFDDVINLYNFDMEIYPLLIDYLGHIETMFRTRIAYTLAMNYGPYALYSKYYFTVNDHYDEFRKRFDDDCKHQCDLLFVEHYNKIYGGIFPPWVGLEIVSFSTLSKLYKNMLDVDKKIVAHGFDVDDEILSNWAYCLSGLRNVCAHYGRVYNTRLHPHAKFSKQVYKKLPFNTETFFSRVYMLCSLLPLDTQRVNLLDKIESITDNHSSNRHFHIAKLGYPQHWKDIFREWRSCKPRA